MAFKVADRVRESTTTTGTGTITLAGTSTGYQTFSAGIGDTNSTYYCISGGAEWEVGIGTFTLTGTTLSRTTVLASSNANALVSFSAGTKDVFCDIPAARINANGATGALTDAVFQENDQTVNNSYTLTTGRNALSAGPITIATGAAVTIPTGATWSIV